MMKYGLYEEIPWGNYAPHVTKEEAIKRNSIKFGVSFKCFLYPTVSIMHSFSTKVDCGDGSLSGMFSVQA